MESFWQNIIVWSLLAISTIIVGLSAIAGWRAVQRGKCGGCASCGDSKDPSRRVVFLPSSNLYNSQKQQKK